MGQFMAAVAAVAVLCVCGGGREREIREGPGDGSWEKRPGDGIEEGGSQAEVECLHARILMERGRGFRSF